MEATFYNTTHLQGKELIKETKNALTQEQFILKLFKKHKKLSASQAWRYFKTRTPLTSVRRAITNLLKKGFISKTDNYTIGYFGKKETIYKIL